MQLEERDWLAVGGWKLALAWGGRRAWSPAWGGCAGTLGGDGRGVCSDVLNLDHEVGGGAPAPVLKGAEMQRNLLTGVYGY